MSPPLSFLHPIDKCTRHAEVQRNVLLHYAFLRHAKDLSDRFVRQLGVWSILSALLGTVRRTISGVSCGRVPPNVIWVDADRISAVVSGLGVGLRWFSVGQEAHHAGCQHRCSAITQYAVALEGSVWPRNATFGFRFYSALKKRQCRIARSLFPNRLHQLRAVSLPSLKMSTAHPARLHPAITRRDGALTHPKNLGAATVLCNGSIK